MLHPEEEVSVWERRQTHLELALRSRPTYKQSQETRKCQDRVCKHGTHSPPEPSNTCWATNTHALHSAHILHLLCQSVLHLLCQVGSERAFIFYFQGIYSANAYPRQVLICHPGVLMLLC